MGGHAAKQRWEVVTFLKSLNNAPGAQTNASVAPAGAIKKSTAPPPHPPFTTTVSRNQVQLVISRSRIFPNRTPRNPPRLALRSSPAPERVAKGPKGFKVEQYATGLNNPRIIRTAPNGDSSWLKPMAATLRSSAESPPMASRSKCRSSPPA